MTTTPKATPPAEVDEFAALRAALASGPTPGPWKVFSRSWSDTSILAPGFDHAICSLDINHATEESQQADESLMDANASLIAACDPATIASLLAAADRVKALEAAEEGAKEAFGVVVQAKRDIEDECLRLRAALDSAHDVIRRNRAAIDRASGAST